MFNLCFVCSVDMRTIQYEAIVRKLAHYLVTLERESQIISNPDVSHSETPLSLPWRCPIPVQEYITTVDESKRKISPDFQMKPNLLNIICQVRHDLDVKRSASIKVTKSTTIYLKVSTALRLSESRLR